jgi:hypothetical protein
MPGGIRAVFLREFESEIAALSLVGRSHTRRHKSAAPNINSAVICYNIAIDSGIAEF